MEREGLLPVREITRILIVEDDPVRCAWFKRKLGRYYCCDQTSEVSQAIEWLSENRYDLILLDHDLRPDHYCSGTPDDGETGLAVAEWIAEHPDAQPGARIVIHSLNHLGAEQMREVLAEAEIDSEHIPFYFLEKELGLRMP